MFEWNNNEKTILQSLNLSLLSFALGGYENQDFKDQLALQLIRYYEFSYVPVELISRLYEEFLGENKQENGLFYTPSHLAKLLIDEAMPLKDYAKITLQSYRLFDPACGSGIFLVLGFKRLVQWWRLQNELKKPSPEILKTLLKNVFGTDKEEQATKLAAFSLCLALCDELSPMQIISDLRFDDLTDSNILFTDFFIDELKVPQAKNEEIIYNTQKNNFGKIKNLKFDLEIGNPPFDRGAIGSYSNKWKNEKVTIPQGQIALKFLADSLDNLKDNGLQCLIIKSSGLLYNSTSEDYKTLLFSKFNILQILDFTALARNKSLWDNGADVASAAIFTRKQEPNFEKNILHLTFRRTKSTKERILFEIDEYDLHFVNRYEAIQNQFIWKINLLGGGRIKNLISRTSNINLFSDFVEKNNCIIGEGYIIGTKGKLNPKYIYEFKTLPTEAINEEKIDYQQLDDISRDVLFEKIPPKDIFTAPNVIFWENIGNKKLPVFFNEISFSFKDKLIGLKHNDKELLKSVSEEFNKNSDFYRFYIF